MTGLSDTHPEIHHKQLESLRRLTETERLDLAFQLSAQVWALARQAYAERFPHLSPDEQLFRFLRAQYGEEIAAQWWQAKTERNAS